MDPDRLPSPALLVTAVRGGSVGGQPVDRWVRPGILVGPQVAGPDGADLLTSAGLWRLQTPEHKRPGHGVRQQEHTGGQGPPSGPSGCTLEVSSQVPAADVGSFS